MEEGWTMMVGAAYLARDAVIYLRQSTEQQVRHNVGSTRYQQAQREHALRFGWVLDQIRIVDDDLGVSGVTTDRPGYQRILGWIREGKVGALLISEVGRGGRDPTGWFELLKLLALHDVLLIVDGRVCDPQNSAEMFVKQIEAVVVARENAMRTETMHRGRLAKVRAGNAVTRPPIGYQAICTRDADRIVRTGRWIKDPDPQIQSAIESVFSTFLRERSLARTVRALQRQDVHLPARVSGHGLMWQLPAVWRIHYVLTHPAYYGAYVYGRAHKRQRAASSHPRAARQLIGQVVELENHHDGYITRAVWEEIQHILRLNAYTPDRPNMGPGPALLQGLVRCQQHRGNAMSVYYPSRARHRRAPHRFQCLGDYLTGGPNCGSVRGRTLEDHVVEAVLDHLQPPKLAALRRLWRDAHERWKREHGRAHVALRQARVDLEKIKQLFLQAEPAHREVRAELEREFERKARALKELESHAQLEEQTAPNPFTEERWNELMALDVRAIWSAPTTDVHDQKELVRTLVKEVIVESVDPEKITVTVAWTDGTPDTHLVIFRTPYFHRQIRELHAAGLDPERIAAALNAKGWRTDQDRPWSRGTVQRVIRARASVASEN